MATIVLSEDDFREAADDNVVIRRSEWRHGTRNTIVFERDGRHWSATIDVHHEEGWQLYGLVECTEVHQVERTVKVWEPVQ